MTGKSCHGLSNDRPKARGGDSMVPSTRGFIPWLIGLRSRVLLCLILAVSTGTIRAAEGESAASPAPATGTSAPLADVLLSAQRPDGSWPPEPGGAIAKFGNTLFTALAILSLTPPYQLLPVYQR